MIRHKSGRDQNDTPLQLATKKGSLACVRLLIDRLQELNSQDLKSVLNEVDANHETILHRSVQSSQSLYEYLRTVPGIDASCKNKDGETAADLKQGLANSKKKEA
jgi:ankyrin repeat protein